MSARAQKMGEDATSAAENPEAQPWPEPELSLYTTEAIAPPRFDHESLPVEWLQWCRDTARSRACPLDFVAINLLASASAWLGNARRAAPTGDWEEHPHFWAAIVSPPSGGKTPSQQPFIEVSKALELDAEPDWKEACAQYDKQKAYAEAKRVKWQGDVKAAEKNGVPPPDKPFDAYDPDAPTRPRMLVSDPTTQQLVNILAGNPKGLLLLRDELAGWIGSFDRYSGAGADRGFYLESWNGGRYTVDLVKHEGKPVSVPYASLSILGGLQPDKLREALSGSDDGFAARFCYVWPQLVPYAPISQENFAVSEQRKDFLLTAARRLRSLDMDQSGAGNPIARRIPLSTGAWQCFEHIREEATGKARTHRGLGAGWHGKTGGRALRIALTIEFLMWASKSNAPEPTSISAEAMAHAGTYLDYSEAMFERVTRGLIVEQADEDAAAVMKLIVQSGTNRLNERELYQMARFTHLRSNKRRAAAFEVLQTHGWIRQAHYAGVGRKRADWMVNPAVHESLS